MTRIAAADLAGVARASQTLLTPLAHETTEDWQRAVTRALRTFLGADRASMLLPASTGGRLFTEDFRREDAIAYAGAIRPLDAQWSVWERQAALGAWDRATLWRPWIAEYLGSAYYNEYVVPRRMFDGVGLSAALGPPGAPATETTAAVLWLHHDRPTGPRFGTRGLALLRALVPAFTAGAETLGRLGAQRGALARTLDALGLALLVADAAGREVHRTPALAALLAGDPGVATLRGEMAQAAAAAARFMRPAYTRSGGNGSDVVALGRAVAREVRTSIARYQLRAVLTAPELLGGAPAVLVSIERVGAVPPSADALQARFGLTPAQARVALLLAEGRPHAAVAAALGVSAHTARHHAEVVYQKLGVRSAAAVAVAVLGAGGGGAGGGGPRD